jgi:hypothetical protein
MRDVCRQRAAVMFSNATAVISTQRSASSIRQFAHSRMAAQHAMPVELRAPFAGDGRLFRVGAVARIAIDASHSSHAEIASWSSHGGRKSTLSAASDRNASSFGRTSSLSERRFMGGLQADNQCPICFDSKAESASIKIVCRAGNVHSRTSYRPMSRLQRSSFAL